MTNQFYVYVWYRADTGLPIYVGKGAGQRWKIHLTAKAHNRRVYHTLKKYGGWCEKVLENISDREALLGEISYIALIGRETNGGPLLNATDGGDGTSGYRHTAEAKLRIRSKFLGIPRSQITIARMRQNRKPYTVSKKTRLRLSESMLIRYKDPEARLLTKMTTKLARSTPQSRQKTVDDLLKRYTDPTAKLRLSEALKGREFSQEHIDNLSTAIRHVWERREFRELQATIWQNPENLKRRGDAISAGWDRPGLKERMGVERKILWSDPNKRANNAEKNVKFWSENPDKLAQRGAAIRAGKARRKAELLVRTGR